MPSIVFLAKRADYSINTRTAQEQMNFSTPELVRDVHYRGVLSMEAAADHLVSFADLLTEPPKAVAPWTCVRGLLESSAIGI